MKYSSHSFEDYDDDLEPLDDEEERQMIRERRLEDDRFAWREKRRSEARLAETYAEIKFAALLIAYNNNWLDGWLGIVNRNGPGEYCIVLDDPEQWAHHPPSVIYIVPPYIENYDRTAAIKRVLRNEGFDWGDMPSVIRVSQEEIDLAVSVIRDGIKEFDPPDPAEWLESICKSGCAKHLHEPNMWEMVVNSVMEHGQKAPDQDHSPDMSM